MSSTPTVTVWYLVHNGEASPSKVRITEDADMDDLRKAIGDDLGLSRVESQSLTLWKPSMDLSNRIEAKVVLATRIREANGRFDDTIATVLQPHEKVTTLIGSGVEQANNDLVHVIVLPNLPKHVASGFRQETTRFHRDLEICVIHLAGANFHKSDLVTNDVVNSSLNDEGTEHLKEYRKKLETRRKMPPSYKSALGPELELDPEVLDDPASSDEYCAFEALHMSLVAQPESRTRYDEHWKQIHTHALFFHHFADYCSTIWDSSDSCKVGFGSHGWPLSLPITAQTSDVMYKYTPKSDFYLSRYGIPRVVVEVKSTGVDDDLVRMLLQGASLVRLVNRLSNRRSFVLMAFYFDNIRNFDRYLLYQRDGTDDKKVSYLKEEFRNIPNDRYRVVQELYNLVHDMAREREHLQLMSELSSISQTLSDNAAFTSRKRSAMGPGAGGNEGAPPTKKTKPQGGTFEADGYELMSTLSNTGLSHVFTVRRLKDGKELIAKISDNAERQILEYLHKKDPPSEHIITLEGTISSSMGLGILLPVRRSVRELCSSMRNAHSGEYRGRLVDFSEQLIKGLAFLHRHGVAHLDIKPDNLMYTNAFQLQIIDFDVAVRVEDEYELVTDDVGTNGFAAPEIGERDYEGRLRYYSPIRADRYSCGVTIRYFLGLDSQGGRYELLGRFASQLMDDDPERRPSLLEWPKLPNIKIKIGNTVGHAACRKRPYRDEDEERGRRTKPRTRGFNEVTALPRTLVTT